ncbi:MAG: tRNA preQ1(34) S-adenosylmethionine ribosyltransferase-isomerase QueA [Lachnospiraceae bacterium]|nr:tRNA preQ1(34) S-adenosylmethionine ribosyltransferase-isomerase QueA [Lachnospiraceae bacterium]
MTGLKKSDFNYYLPERLIAQDPLEDRTSSRLLVLDKNNGNMLHKHFYEIGSFLRKGDCLVINDTKVIPARLMGHREGHQGVCEVLLLKRLSTTDWECIVRPGKKLRTGTVVIFGQEPTVLKGEIKEVLPDGNRIISFSFEGVFEEVLDKLGTMPLPPYITHELKDKNRYQTVYAKHEGSAAAPTAGLHFTKELLESISEMGVEIVRVTLHVGLGTFRPVKEENILDHHMHTESYEVTEEAAAIINAAKERGSRIISVGTTSCRTLEAASHGTDRVVAGRGDTDIFIYPGYKFNIVDSLITNFHLPQSTLIMLVAALCGRENILHAYEEAVKNEYRFFSFGDAMFITDI